MPAERKRALIDVPIELLDDGTNVRTPQKRMNSLDYGLVSSIREHGVLQAITVVPRGDRFEVLYGHRRTAAARLAGLKSVPAIVEATPADKPLRQLIENEHRRRVDPMGIARALRAWLDAQPGRTQAELARQVARPQSWVNRHLALLELDDVTQAKVAAGSIGVEAAAKFAPRPRQKLGRPRILQDSDDGTSRSVVVPLSGGKSSAGQGSAKATIGIEHGAGTVELLLEQGDGYGVMVTLDLRSALLLARRLNQASQAAQATVQVAS